MNQMTPKRVALFVGVMTAVATVIYIPRFHPELLQPHQEMGEHAQIDAGNISPAEDSKASFSIEAGRILATDNALQTKTKFGQMFAVECVSASQSERKFSGYGIATDLVVVTARFRLSAATNSAGNSNWSKTYEVSESIDSAQFQGLRSADTVQRVVRTLTELLHGDNEFLRVLHNPSKP